MRMMRIILGKPSSLCVEDFGLWITNGIEEIRNCSEIELHVVSPYPHLRNSIQEFTQDGVHYHFFRNEDESIRERVLRRKIKYYKANRRLIFRIMNRIKPDIVHLFGAENPYYALALLDVPRDIPTIVQLQTLLNDPKFRNTCHSLSKDYVFRSQIEKLIISKATYVGTIATKYREIIKKSINGEAHFLDISLALTEPVYSKHDNKQFDFVYFAANISKAADLAFEAFAIAHNRYPGITLNVIGSYSVDFKAFWDKRLVDLGIADAVTFEGALSTHEMVLAQIRKSRFALLPLRVDLTSSTIREAMANGLPVLTTDTGEFGTQILNYPRPTVLLSSIGDHHALANNMDLLLNSRDLQNSLRENGYLKAAERQSNRRIVLAYIDAYKACLNK